MLLVPVLVTAVTLWLHEGQGTFGRRHMLAASAAFSHPGISLALSSGEAQALEEASLSNPGKMLANGIRVIDVREGDGPLPQLGDRVYVHFKVWTKGFQSGQPADTSFVDTRPSAWLLGDPSVVTRGLAFKPTSSLPVGIDLGVAGMREGGWRRLVVPAALGYGEAGLPVGTRGLYAVQPNSDIYVDLRLMDGGSGLCDEILRKGQIAKSISCKRGMP